MPTIFTEDGFRFFFYSNEGNPREPRHVHVRRAGAEAKFWLEPEIALAESHGFDARALARLAWIVEARKDVLREAWDDHFR